MFGIISQRYKLEEHLQSVFLPLYITTVNSGSDQVTVKWPEFMREAVRSDRVRSEPLNVPEVFMSESQSVLGADGGVKSHPASVIAARKRAGLNPPASALPLCPLHYLLWVFKWY